MSLFKFTSCVKFEFCSEMKISSQMKSHYSLFLFILLINGNNKTNKHYFFKDMINIKNFDPKLLKIDKKQSKGIIIYYIGYITKKPEYNINIVNPLYLLVDEIDGFIEQKEGSKYLNIALTDSNNGFLIKYAEVWSAIKN